MPFRSTLLLLYLPLIAWGAPIAHPFYEEKAQGWFWKEKIPEPPKAPEPERPKASAPSPSPPLRSPSDEPLTSAWFRAHLGTIRDAALDDPSPEKVRQYFLLQKVLLDKAQRFAESAKRVVFQDPSLDERAHHASTPTALALEHQAQHDGRQMDLSRIGGKAGLLFIFRSDCRYCHLMAPLINALCQRTGIRLYSVSLDGGGLPGLPEESLVTDPALGHKLNLTVTPTLFLMVPGNGIHPVLEGSSSEVELEDRVIAAGRTAGLIANSPQP